MIELSVNEGWSKIAENTWVFFIIALIIVIIFVILEKFLGR